MVLKDTAPTCSGSLGFLSSLRLKPRFIIGLIALLACVATTRAENKPYAATNLWKAYVGVYNQSSPAMDSNGVIYVTTWLGKLYAINPDGSQKWVTKFGHESVSTPAIGEDGTIYFGSRDRHIRAVSPEGKVKWKSKAGGWVDASPAIGVDGTIYCGSWDKKFYALNPDGTKKWEFVTGGPIVSSAAIDDAGVIYFGSHDRNFYALNPDGTKRWEFAAGAAITSSPAIGSEGELFFSSVNGKLHAVNRDGTARWQLHTDGFTQSSPVLGTNELYISAYTNHCAVSLDGKLNWQRHIWDHWPGTFADSTAAVLANGEILFNASDGIILACVKFPDWNWIYSFGGGSSYTAPLVGPDGTVYGMSMGPNLHAIQRYVPLAKSTWPMFRANPQRTGRVSRIE